MALWRKGSGVKANLSPEDYGVGRKGKRWKIPSKEYKAARERVMQKLESRKLFQEYLDITNRVLRHLEGQTIVSEMQADLKDLNAFEKAFNEAVKQDLVVITGENPEHAVSIAYKKIVLGKHLDEKSLQILKFCYDNFLQEAQNQVIIKINAHLRNFLTLMGRELGIKISEEESKGISQALTNPSEGELPQNETDFIKLFKERKKIIEEWLLGNFSRFIALKQFREYKKKVRSYLAGEQLIERAWLQNFFRDHKIDFRRGVAGFGLTRSEQVRILKTLKSRFDAKVPPQNVFEFVRELAVKIVEKKLFPEFLQRINSLALSGNVRTELLGRIHKMQKQRMKRKDILRVIDSFQRPKTIPPRKAPLPREVTEKENAVREVIKAFNKLGIAFNSPNHADEVKAVLGENFGGLTVEQLSRIASLAKDPKNRTKNASKTIKQILKIL